MDGLEPNVAMQEEIEELREVNKALIEAGEGLLDWLEQMFPDEPLFHGDPSAEQSFRIKDLRDTIAKAKGGAQ